MMARFRKLLGRLAGGESDVVHTSDGVTEPQDPPVQDAELPSPQSKRHLFDAVSATGEPYELPPATAPSEPDRDLLIPVAPPTKVPAPLREEKVPIVIGIDFGTSSTKVAYRKLGDAKSWVLPAAQPDSRFPWFSTPTVYQLRDGNVWFGTLGEDSRQSLKLALLRSTSPEGVFGTPEREAVAYLGFIIEGLKLLVEKYLSVDAFSPRFSIGIPMAYTETHKEELLRHERYALVARAAVATSTFGGGPGIEQAMPQEEVQRIVDEAIPRAHKIDTVTILPESMAALVSLSKDPSIQSRAYTVVDIGAGTTDVSTSHFRMNRSGQHKLACYHDSSEPHGAYELEDRLRADPTDRAPLSRIWSQWTQSWMKGKEIDQRNYYSHRAWRRTTVVFTGGGGQNPAVLPHFHQQRKYRCPVVTCFQDQADLHVNLYSPSEQVLGSQGLPTDTRKALHMLAVAHGLTYMKREWPQFFSSDQVHPPPAQEEHTPAGNIPWV